MIQAGVISGALETSVSKPVTVHDHPLQTQDPNLLPEYAQSGIEIDAKVPSMVSFHLESLKILLC